MFSSGQELSEVHALHVPDSPRHLSIHYLNVSICLARRSAELARHHGARRSRGAAGDHVPAMSAPHAFALTVRRTLTRILTR